jgi:hypothetical protein
MRFTSLSFLMFVILGTNGCSSIENSWNAAVEGVIGRDSDTTSKQQSVAELVAELAESDGKKSDVVSKKLNEGLSNLATSSAQAIDNKISNSHTEVHVTGIENGKPRFEFSNVTGINSYGDRTSQTFLQSSANNTNGRTTLNLGIGQRYLSDDENLITGINAFIDYNVDYGHQRSGVGMEVKSPAFDLTANSYFGLTDWKTGKDSNQEKALDGYDVELAGQVPFIPSAKIYLQKFKWDMNDATDIEGNTYGLGLSHVFGSGIGLEIGRKDFDGSKTDQDFIKVGYSVRFGAEIIRTDTPFVSGRMFETGSVKNRMLEKIRRNNAIVVQTKFSSGVSGV